MNASSRPSQVRTLAKAVEALARALGWWLGEGAGGPKWRGADRWTVYVTAGGAFVVSKWDGPYFRNPIGRWSLSALEAYLWLRCALLGATRERCPDCEGRPPMNPATMVDAVVITRRRRYAECEASVFPLHRAADNRVSTGGAIKHGTIEECEEFAKDLHCVGVTSECFDRSEVYGSERDLHDLVEKASRPCPTCKGPDVECSGPGDYHGTPVTCEVGWLQPHVVIGTGRSCPECNPGNLGTTKGKQPGEATGWITHEHGWAERFLRAMPRKCDHSATLRAIEGGDGRLWSTGPCPSCGQDPYLDEVDIIGDPGDLEAREQISVKADELAERGQPGCSTCEGSQFEKTGTVLGFLATGTLDMWEREHPESEGWSVWSQPERGVMVGGGDGVRIVCRRPCPSCAGARQLGLWLALWLAGSPCPTCGGWGKPSAKMKAQHREHERRRGPQPEMAALMRPCGDCRGEGTALAGHADAMAKEAHALAPDLERAEAAE